MARRSRGPEVTFQTIDVDSLWEKLELTAAQLSALTGLTRRQVQWWRQRGYLPASDCAEDRYNGVAVQKALLMKQAVDAGITPARAHRLADAKLVHTPAATTADVVPDSSGVFDLREKLVASHNTIGQVLEAIALIARRVEGVAEERAASA